jgi:hypothetical protein
MRQIVVACFGAILWAATFVSLNAFPVIAGTAVSVDTTTNTSQVGSLPGSLASGDLLIGAFYGSATDATPHTASSGWTILADREVVNAVGHLAVFYKVSNGAEGATVTFTTDLSEDSAFCVYRITGQHVVTAPVISASVVSTSTAPNSALLEPPWALEDTTYITIGGADGSAVDFTAYPTSYDTSQITSPTHTASGGACAMAARDYTSLSDDPGAFTIDSNVRWAAFTVAVRNQEPPIPAPRRIL